MQMRRAAAVAAVVLILVVATPGGVSAQSYAVDRGSVLISGRASATSRGIQVDGTDTGSRLTQLTLAPSVEYFIAPGVAVGGRTSLSWSSNGDGLSVVTYGIGPKATYYFGREPRTWYPYVSAAGLLYGVRFDDVSNSQLGFEAMGGALAMLSSSVGLNGELFVQMLRQDTDGGTEFDQDAFGFRVGVSAFLF